MDYNIEQFNLRNQEGLEYDAYRVHPGNTPPRYFAGVNNLLAFRFNESVDHVVYSFDGINFNEASHVSANNITPGKFILLNELKMNNLTLFIDVLIFH